MLRRDSPESGPRSGENSQADSTSSSTAICGILRRCPESRSVPLPSQTHLPSNPVVTDRRVSRGTRWPAHPSFATCPRWTTVRSLQSPQREVTPPAPAAPTVAIPISRFRSCSASAPAATSRSQVVSARSARRRRPPYSASWRSVQPMIRWNWKPIGLPIR